MTGMRVTAGPGWIEVRSLLRTRRVDLATVNDVHLRKDNVALGDVAGHQVEVPLDHLLRDAGVRRVVHEGLKAARVAGLVHGDDLNLVLAKTSCA
jgi:hypothetical protein